VTYILLVYKYFVVFLYCNRIDTDVKGNCARNY